MKPLHTHRPIVRARLSRARALAWCGALVVSLVALPVVAGRSVPAGAALPAAAVSCPGPTYTVVSGDYWIRIASRHNVTLTALLAVNKATTKTVIHPAQVICLPVGTATTTAPTTATTKSGSGSTVASGPTAIKQFPVQGLCWFSDSWGAPRSGGRKHEGVDIIAAQGQKVYAADDGVLTKQYIDAPGLLSGNGWRLTRADGTYYFYGHFSGFAPGLKVGSPVVAGQIIGYVGKTGAAGTPHVHFEVHPGGGAAVNPTPIVTAVNGCKITAVPSQPGAAVVTTLAPSTSLASATTTTKPTGSTTPTTTATTAAPTTAATTTTATAPVANGLWQFIAPLVVFDTGTTPLPAATPRSIVVTGRQGFFADVPGVMVRAVVKDPTTSGFLTLHPCGAEWSTTSTLNFGPGRVSSVVTMVPVSGSGFCATSSVSTNVRLEVLALQMGNGVGVVPVDSRRALDTRTTAPLAAGATATVGINQLNAPQGSKAVTVTLTLLNAAAAGTLSVGPCGGTPWTVAFAAGAAQSFSSVVRINDAGLCLKSTAQVHAIVDVTGVWTGDQPMASITARRLVDTRSSTVLSPTTRRVAAGADGRTRAQLSLVLIGAPSGGAVYAWNCSRPRPVASVAYTPGPTATVNITMDVTGGEVCLAASGPVHAIVDVVAVG